MFLVTARLARALTLVHITSCFHSDPHKLNKSVQIAEARTTDAERQAQERRNSTATGARDRRGRAKSIGLNRSRVRTTSGENGFECFAVGRDDSLVAH